MVVTRAELAKQEFEPRVTGSLEAVLKVVRCSINKNTKEARIYRETELEDGINPEVYYLFVRK